MERLFSKQDLRRLIIPLVFEQTLAITVGMADTMMVASVGEAAISGVSLVDMVNVLIFSILAALSTGGAVVVSQNLGAGKYDEACHSANQLLYTVIFAGVLLMGICLIFRIPILRLFFGRIENDVMENSVIYLMITAASFPFLAVYNACAALFRSMGNSQITLKISVLINLINIESFLENADGSKRVINFLGFTFDGTTTTLRAKTVSKYYYRMYRKAHAIAGNPDQKGKDHLYERYSERGARPSGKDSGNFFTYVQRAERIFGDTEEIRKPVKKHMAKIKRALKKPHN